LLEAVERAGRVDESSTGIHRDGDPEGLGDLVFGPPGLDRGLDMAGDTAVAAGDRLAGEYPD
jgi:hypothetical protein